MSTEVQLPDDLKLVPAGAVREAWHMSEPTLWRAEKTGALPAIRIGRRRFYRVTDLRAFLDRAAKAPPVAVPWAKQPAAFEPQKKKEV